MNTEDCRILIVDDNSTNLDVAAGIIQKLGYATDVARNGEEAVQAVAEKP